MDKKMKWYTVQEYIDKDTGEIISKSLKEREYIVQKKEIKYEKSNEIYGIKKIINECEKNRQIRLF